MKEVKILIVDDHTLMRSGLKLMLSNERGIRVVGEAANGEDALCLAAELAPDIVLMDVSMSGMSGLDCLVRLREFNPEIRVILLTMHEDGRYLKAGFTAGAMGYVLKKAADDVLFQAIRTVCDGQVFVQDEMARALANELRLGNDAPKIEATRALSDQEQKVLTYVARGHSNAEIAVRLSVSTRTVETYKYRIMEKLNTKKRADLVKYAFDHGLFSKE